MEASFEVLYAHVWPVEHRLLLLPLYQHENFQPLLQHYVCLHGTMSCHADNGQQLWNCKLASI